MDLAGAATGANCEPPHLGPERQAEEAAAVAPTAVKGGIATGNIITSSSSSGGGNSNINSNCGSMKIDEASKTSTSWKEPIVISDAMAIHSGTKGGEMQGYSNSGSNNSTAIVVGANISSSAAMVVGNTMVSSSSSAAGSSGGKGSMASQASSYPPQAFALTASDLPPSSTSFAPTVATRTNGGGGGGVGVGVGGGGGGADAGCGVATSTTGLVFATPNGTVKPTAGMFVPGARGGATATTSAAAGAGAAASSIALVSAPAAAHGKTCPSAPMPSRALAKAGPGAGAAAAKVPGPDPANGKSKVPKVSKSKGKSKKKNTLGSVMKNWKPIDDKLACNVCLDEQDYINNPLMQCARCVLWFGFGLASFFL